MRVGVVGATGYAGQQAVWWLARHPELKLVTVASAHEAGGPTDSYFAGLPGIPNRFGSIGDLDHESLDVIFACQGPGQLTAAIANWADGGARVVDLSADFRFRDLAVYERYYGSHPMPVLARHAVSGYADDPAMAYRGAKVVGNPGCYPTAFYMAIGPLVREGVTLGTVLVDGKSGVSGAGRRPQTHLLMAEMAENVEAYSLPGEHRHTGEMEEAVAAPVVFQPHYMPIARGMEVTIYLPGVSIGVRDVLATWQRFYAGSPFVQIVMTGYPRTARVRGTNRAELAVRRDERTGTVVLYCAIDNLGKGAAGQAIQHANRWLGLDPALGLL
ncbi:MAG: N-acetyl-gamma-glutamyl-phosphate reductase [Thermaerobacter sp.]|nr:N-acetyl-gamma-glutamyl-phosphate reductase [Thermaerobacter sp.]